jgi:hypothetical protein
MHAAGFDEKPCPFMQAIQRFSKAPVGGVLCIIAEHSFWAMAYFMQIPVGGSSTWAAVAGAAVAGAAGAGAAGDAGEP